MNDRGKKKKCFRAIDDGTGATAAAVVDFEFEIRSVG